MSANACNTRYRCNAVESLLNSSEGLVSDTPLLRTFQNHSKAAKSRAMPGKAVWGWERRGRGGGMGRGRACCTPAGCAAAELTRGFLTGFQEVSARRVSDRLKWLLTSSMSLELHKTQLLTFIQLLQPAEQVHRQTCMAAILGDGIKLQVTSNMDVCLSSVKIQWGSLSTIQAGTATTVWLLGKVSRLAASVC